MTSANYWLRQIYKTISSGVSIYMAPSHVWGSRFSQSRPDLALDESSTLAWCISAFCSSLTLSVLQSDVQLKLFFHCWSEGLYLSLKEILWPHSWSFTQMLWMKLALVTDWPMTHTCIGRLKEAQLNTICLICVCV